MTTHQAAKPQAMRVMPLRKGRTDWRKGDSPAHRMSSLPARVVMATAPALTQKVGSRASGASGL